MPTHSQLLHPWDGGWLLFSSLWFSVFFKCSITKLLFFIIGQTWLKKSFLTMRRLQRGEHKNWNYYLQGHNQVAARWLFGFHESEEPLAGQGSLGLLVLSFDSLSSWNDIQGWPVLCSLEDMILQLHWASLWRTPSPETPGEGVALWELKTGTTVVL